MYLRDLTFAVINIMKSLAPNEQEMKSAADPKLPVHIYAFLTAGSWYRSRLGGGERGA